MARNNRASSMEKPMNVEQIVKIAENQQIDPQFSIQRYFRSAALMVKQASIYEHEGNEQTAYLLLYRHALLILNDLAKHPQAKEPKYEHHWSEARKTVNRNLQKLELLKPKINERYARYLERRKALAAQTQSHASSRAQTQSLEASYEALSIDGENYRSSSQRDGSPDRFDPNEHRDMAVRLANHEIGRRGRLGSRSPEEADVPTISSAQSGLQSTMTDARRRAELSTARVPPRTSSRRSSSHKPYNYPRVDNLDSTSGGLQLPTFTSVKQQSRDSTAPPPPRPPKHGFEPRVPSKEPLAFTPASNKLPASLPPPVPQKTAASPPQSPKLEYAQQFLPSAFLENGSPLRTMFFPGGLRRAFLRVAEPNTRRNLETCGMLCGTLLRNAFFVTKLVIPEQTSTSDTCEMVNEEALHSYCDDRPPGEELMVLGWIHTHPTQTAFMSSRDLHTHCWYQVQLPESIAVVCAPSRVPDYGFFRLTDPPGLNAIKRCKLPGIFHPHEESHIFTDAKGRPGHVIEHDDLEFETVDLRPSAS